MFRKNNTRVNNGQSSTVIVQVPFKVKQKTRTNSLGQALARRQPLTRAIIIHSLKLLSFEKYLTWARLIKIIILKNLIPFIEVKHLKMFFDEQNALPNKKARLAYLQHVLCVLYDTRGKMKL